MNDRCIVTVPCVGNRFMNDRCVVSPCRWTIYNATVYIIM